MNRQSTNPANLMAERDFYKFPRLTDGDLALLLQTVQLTKDPDMREMSALNLLRYFSWSEFLGIAAYLPEPQRRRIHDRAIQTEESFLSEIEGRAAPTIEALRQGNERALDSSRAARDFFIFLGLQFCRTKPMRGMAQRIFTSAPDLPRGVSAAVAQPLASMMGFNLAYVLLADMDETLVLAPRNDTGTTFVVGDRPVVNIAVPLDGSPTRSRVLYYPLSPHRAFVLLPKKVAKSLAPVSVEMVRDLNVWMAEASTEFLVGHSYEALEAVEAQRPFARPSMDHCCPTNRVEKRA